MVRWWGWTFTAISARWRSSIRPAAGARGRVPSTREDLQLFAQRLAPGDRVALEVTGNAWEIARILEAHVARVVVVSPSDTGIGQAGPRPTAWTRWRWPSCWRPGRWTRSGCPTSRSARCAGGWPGARSWSAGAQASKNEVPDTRAQAESPVGGCVGRRLEIHDRRLTRWRDLDLGASPLHPRLRAAPAAPSLEARAWSPSPGRGRGTAHTRLRRLVAWLSRWPRHRSAGSCASAGTPSGGCPARDARPPPRRAPPVPDLADALAPAAPRVCGRDGQRGLAAHRHPAPAWPQRPRRHLDLPPRERLR
jgi:hypothetical protein